MKKFTFIFVNAILLFISVPVAAKHDHHHSRSMEESRSIIAGTVFSTEDGEVVDFATVYLKGTNYGCATGEDGVFQIKAPAGDYTLVASALGYSIAEKHVTLGES